MIRDTRVIYRMLRVTSPPRCQKMPRHRKHRTDSHDHRRTHCTIDLLDTVQGLHKKPRPTDRGFLNPRERTARSERPSHLRAQDIDAVVELTDQRVSSTVGVVDLRFIDEQMGVADVDGDAAGRFEASAEGQP